MKILRYAREIFEKGLQSVIRNTDNTTTKVRIGYSHEPLKMHIETLVNLYNKQKVENQGSMNLNHPRGEALKSFEASLLCRTHMFSLKFKDDGATSCPVFFMMITGGKTNQGQNKLYSGVIRHKAVQTCAFEAIGFYLSYRFQVKGKAFPEFYLE
ncbi:hypothetical protein BDF21DRAFT_468645 [Thamnidium elegans]|nr:hypothetical protein BDF21DRAFT_468645 [Thamnidium elegans]